jgi:hypothetical protein
MLPRSFFTPFFAMKKGYGKFEKVKAFFKKD